MRIENQNLEAQPDKIRCLCVGLAVAAVAPLEINYLTLQLVKRRDNAAGGGRQAVMIWQSVCVGNPSLNHIRA